MNHIKQEALLYATSQIASLKNIALIANKTFYMPE